MDTQNHFPKLKIFRFEVDVQKAYHQNLIKQTRSLDFKSFAFFHKEFKSQLTKVPLMSQH